VKNCSRCKELKSKLDFHKRTISPDGLAYKCKDCDTKDKNKWKDDNRDKFKATNKRYLKDPAVREKNKVRAKAWREANKERSRTKVKEWHRENPERSSYHKAKHHYRKGEATPPWLTEEQLDLMSDMHTLCRQIEKFMPDKYHVDHIVPLQGKNVCGLNVPWNLQILEASCNIRKGNRYDV